MVGQLDDLHQTGRPASFRDALEAIAQFADQGRLFKLPRFLQRRARIVSQQIHHAVDSSELAHIAPRQFFPTLRRGVRRHPDPFREHLAGRRLGEGRIPFQDKFEIRTELRERRRVEATRSLRVQPDTRPPPPNPPGGDSDQHGGERRPSQASRPTTTMTPVPYRIDSFQSRHKAPQPDGGSFQGSGAGDSPP